MNETLLSHVPAARECMCRTPVTRATDPTAEINSIKDLGDIERTIHNCGPVLALQTPGLAHRSQSVTIEQIIITAGIATTVYLAVYFVVQVALFCIAFRSLSRRVRRQQESKQEPELAAEWPLISILVPAYNEAPTISECVRSLLRLEYPNLEIIICNDGSNDGTPAVLQRDFQFFRTTPPPGGAHFNTARVLGYYESRCPHPKGLRRMILVDKLNGGKADALNACMNVAYGDYITTIDADSLLEQDALLTAAKEIMRSEEPIVALGAQIGLSNGSMVSHGRLIKPGAPTNWCARFQLLEYMRTFAMSRAAFSETNSLLVLSGVFVMLRRDLAVSVGGFLTKEKRTALGKRHSDTLHTVTEDFEIILRMRRYLIEHNQPGRITLLPVPLAWTQAPERYTDLGKQRSRWYQGLLETLFYHRKMMLRPWYKRIGLFQLPYQFLFEALAPIVEATGYVLLGLAVAAGIVSWPAFFAFLAAAVGAHVLVTGAGAFLARYPRTKGDRAHQRRMLPPTSVSQRFALFLAAIASNFGYRQFLMFWQMRGLLDFLNGRCDWNKFEREEHATANANENTLNEQGLPAVAGTSAVSNTNTIVPSYTMALANGNHPVFMPTTGSHEASAQPAASPSEVSDASDSQPNSQPTELAGLQPDRAPSHGTDATNRRRDSESIRRTIHGRAATNSRRSSSRTDIDRQGGHNADIHQAKTKVDHTQLDHVSAKTQLDPHQLHSKTQVDPEHCQSSSQKTHAGSHGLSQADAQDFEDTGSATMVNALPVPQLH